MGREGALCVCQSCAIGNSCLDFCRRMRDGSRRREMRLLAYGRRYGRTSCRQQHERARIIGGCWTELMRASLARALIGDASTAHHHLPGEASMDSQNTLAFTVPHWCFHSKEKNTSVTAKNVTTFRSWSADPTLSPLVSFSLPFFLALSGARPAAGTTEYRHISCRQVSSYTTRYKSMWSSDAKWCSE